MEKRGIHRVTVDDGVELAGHVYGRGPAVVFVHGALGDGEEVWSKLMPHFSDHFRCYLMDMRGTGMSEDHSDLSPKRQARDVAAFVESIGEPVGVVGESGGAIWTLGAAARSGRYIPRQLREFEQVGQSDYSPTAPGVIEKISVPFLLTFGTHSLLSDWFEDGVRHIAEHVDDARIRKLEGLGHAAPVLQPEVIAEELRQFFERMLPRAESPRPRGGA